MTRAKVGSSGRAWSERAGGARGESARNTLSRAGLAVVVVLRSGERIFADVVAALRDGRARVRPWGVDRDVELAISDVAVATAAEVTTHADFAAIRKRQREVYKERRGT